MDSNINWRSPLITRLGILIVTIFAFVYAFEDTGFVNMTIKLGLGAAIFFQVVTLMKLVEKSNDNISSFLDAIRFDDLSSSFKTESKDPSVQRLHRELNEALTKLRNSRKEKDSEYQFFKNIVQHVGIGLLTFKKDGTIQIINSAAKRLLRVRLETTLTA